MSKTTKIIVITYLAFGIYFLLDGLYFNAIRESINQVIKNGGISHILTYIISGLPLYLGVILIHNKNKVTDSLGFLGSFWQGCYISLLFTLPMFIGFALMFKLNSEMNLDEFLIKVVAAAFFEELFFRSLLFGQVFRFTKMGFIPSVLFGALLFGFIHLYQSQEFYESIGIFAITFLGGILFAWVYAEWNYNIWIPVFLHLFMNLAAMTFSATENALGGIYFNVFRTITVLLVILGTIIYKMKKNSKLEVHRQNLWIKKITHKSIKN
ncbi:MAG: type II CAAX endopeptidase family protein [Flavobacterium sp.]|uniref:CPBP family intramembrane glutamic endopeptidase n=1 Tax=Flavobacterium sp. TaxID=239 RepID=UPI002609A4E8|nr:type II CAAX endopeptidase family protein [Flavobacterium sp.]MDD5150464.1 type II CAAX endopeptidase family protein [Flavobacterium sp.]